MAAKVYPANPKAAGVEADHPGFTLEEHYYPALEDPAKMAELKSKMTVADFKRMKKAGDTAIARKKEAEDLAARLAGASAPAVPPDEAPAAPAEAPAEAPTEDSEISAAAKARNDARERAHIDREEQHRLTQQVISGGFTASDTEHFGDSIVVSRSREFGTSEAGVMKEQPVTRHPALALAHAESQPGMSAMIFQRTGKNGVGVVHHLVRGQTAASERGHFTIASSSPITESTFLSRFTTPESHKTRDASRAELEEDIRRTEVQAANLHAEALENIPEGFYGMSLVSRGRGNFLNMLRAAPADTRRQITNWYNRYFEDRPVTEIEKPPPRGHEGPAQLMHPEITPQMMEKPPPPGHEGPAQLVYPGINSLLSKLEGTRPEYTQSRAGGQPLFTDPVYQQAVHPETGRKLYDDKGIPIYEQEQAKHPETGEPLFRETKHPETGKVVKEPVMQNVIAPGGEPKPVMKWKDVRGLYDRLASKKKAAVEPSRELASPEYDPEFHKMRLAKPLYTRTSDQPDWAGRSSDALERALGTVLPERLRDVVPAPDTDIDNPLEREKKHQAALKAADVTHPHHALQVAADRLEVAVGGLASETNTPGRPLHETELDPNFVASAGFDELAAHAQEQVDTHPAWAPMLAEIAAARTGYRQPTSSRPRFGDQLLDIARAVSRSTLPGVRAQQSRQFAGTPAGGASGEVVQRNAVRGEGTNLFPMNRLSAEKHGVAALRAYEKEGRWHLSEAELEQREREAEAEELRNIPEREEADIVPDVEAAEGLAKDYGESRAPKAPSEEEEGAGLSEEEKERQREAMTSVERAALPKEKGEPEFEPEIGVEEAEPEEGEAAEEGARAVTPTSLKTLAEELHPLKVEHHRQTMRARRAAILTQYADLVTGGRAGELPGGPAGPGSQGRIPVEPGELGVHGPITAKQAYREGRRAERVAVRGGEHSEQMRQLRSEHVGWLEDHLAHAVATRSGWDVGEGGKINFLKGALRQYGKDYPEEFPQHALKDPDLPEYEGDVRTEHEAELARLSQGGMTTAERTALAGTVDPVQAAEARAAQRQFAQEQRARGVEMVRSMPSQVSREALGIPEGEGSLTGEHLKTYQEARLKVYHENLQQAAAHAANQVMARALGKKRQERQSEIESAMRAPERSEEAPQGYAVESLIDPEQAKRLRQYASVRSQISEEEEAAVRVARGEEWREQEREREFEAVPSVRDVVTGPQRQIAMIPHPSISRSIPERGIAIDVSGMSAAERDWHRRNVGRDVMGQADQIPGPAPVDDQDSVAESVQRGIGELQGSTPPRHSRPVIEPSRPTSEIPMTEAGRTAETRRHRREGMRLHPSAFVKPEYGAVAEAGPSQTIANIAERRERVSASGGREGPVLPPEMAQAKGEARQRAVVQGRNPASVTQAEWNPNVPEESREELHGPVLPPHMSALKEAAKHRAAAEGRNPWEISRSEWDPTHPEYSGPATQGLEYFEAQRKLR